MFTVEQIDYTDKNVWDLFCSGKTLGIFQSESRLVQNWLRKIQPRNLWELSAVISAVRPGVLVSGYADLYVDNKNNPTKIEKFGNEIVDQVFDSTHSVMLYQEQLMFLGMRLAWKHKEENDKLILVDLLRRGVSKKDQAKVLAIGKEFVDGCIHNGLEADKAQKLFEVIKNCGRYLFNLSHSIAYAYLSYQTAYLKYYYPAQFYTTYMNFSTEKLDPEEELYNLIQDAKSAGFDILPPNINCRNTMFEMVNKNTIRFGLRFIRFVGKTFDDGFGDIPQIKTWQEVVSLALGDYSIKPRSNTMDSMISAGCFSDCCISRNVLLYVTNFLRNLTPKELNYIRPKLIQCENIISLCDIILETINNASAKKRRQMLESELELLRKFIQENPTDHPIWIEKKELAVMGVIVSPCVTKEYEKYSTHTCFDCNNLHKEQDMEAITLIGVIDDISFHTIKTGKNIGKKMAKIAVRDSTGKLENLPVFAKEYDQYQDDLEKDNILQLELSHKCGRGFKVNSLSVLNYAIQH